MQKLTQKELRHTNRVVRVLLKASRDLEKLSLDASSSDIFPKTTLKAYTEVSEVLNKTKMRIFARHADAA